MPLTNTKCQNTNATSRVQKLFDGDGLFLQIAKKGTKGGRYWRLKYRLAGKERLLSLGTFPEVSLAEAREKRTEARKLVAKGIDPSQTKQAEKIAQAGSDSFEVIAREWLARNKAKWTESYQDALLRRLELNVFPWLGKRPVDQITPPELLAALRRAEGRGALETAHRTRALCSQIFRYAIATGRLTSDPSRDLVGALASPFKKHFPTLTDPVAIGGLLRAMDEYYGQFSVKCALQLAPLVFVRPGELRQAEWSEFDLENAEWRIPAAKMKMREQHIVPLSRQAVAILKELQPLTGNGAAAKYLFPSVRTMQRPMSDNTLNSALRRMGYTRDMIVAHGFRSMASTLLNEKGFNRDAIEAQLAHGDRNKVRASYNFAKYLPERREMMQAWADYLDELRVGGKVINAKFGGKHG